MAFGSRLGIGVGLLVGFFVWLVGFGIGFVLLHRFFRAYDSKKASAAAVVRAEEQSRKIAEARANGDFDRWENQ